MPAENRLCSAAAPSASRAAVGVCFDAALPVAELSEECMASKNEARFSRFLVHQVATLQGFISYIVLDLAADEKGTRRPKRWSQYA